MKINVIAVGRLKAGPERELCTRYFERAIATGKNQSLTGFTPAQINESRAGNAKTRKADEATHILAALNEEDYVIALDERGKTMDSQKFAHLLQNERDDARPALSFVIGGADGLDASVRDRANLVLSFSPLTWPHQLVRIMLAEQLYRAITIMTGHPYHKS